MLSKYSIKKPFTIIVVILIVCVIGFVAIFNIPLDLFPSLEIPVLLVATVAPGSAPEVVENDVTSPIEQALKTVNNVKTIDSMSSENYSIVIVQFSSKVDLNKATNDIQAQLNMVKMQFDDMVMDPFIIKMDPNMLPIMNIAISKSGSNLNESSEYLKDLSEKIQSADGVASVSASGLVDNFVFMQLSTDNMSQSVLLDVAMYLLSQKDNPNLPAPIKALIDAIFAMISNPSGNLGDLANLPDDMLGGITDMLSKMISKDMIEAIIKLQDFEMPAGIITENGVDYYVKLGDKISSLNDLKNTPVLSLPFGELMGGQMSTIDAETYLKIKLLLGENGALIDTLYTPNDSGGYTMDTESLAWIASTPKLTLTLNSMCNIFSLDNASSKHTIINGSAGVMVSIMKQPDYSTVTVTKAVNKMLKSLQANDKTISYIVLLDQGEEIQFMLSTIVQNLIVGAVLAIIILLLFLKDIRPTITVGLSIFISVIGTIALMYVFGVSLNLVSMGGLALAIGMLVDNSIVVIENIYRKKSEGVSAIKASYEGAKQVASAIISSTLTTVIVFLPIIFVEGMTKEIFSDLALTITFSLSASLIIALTLVPMVASRILNKPIKEEYKFFKSLKSGYVKALDFMLNKKWITSIVVVVLFATSILTVFFMEKEFMPSTDSATITINAKIDNEKLGNSTYDEIAEDLINEMYKTLSNFNFVENIGIEKTGGLGIGGMNIGGGEIKAYVLLDKKSQRKIDKTKNEIYDALEKITNLPDDCVSFDNPNSDSSASSSSSMMDTRILNIDVTGKNLALMRKDTTALTEILSKIPGVENVENSLGNSPLEYYIKVDKKKANTYGLYNTTIFLEINKLLAPVSSSHSVRINESLTSYDVYIYGFDYSINRWHRLPNPTTGQMERIYIGSNGEYYMLDSDNNKQAVTKNGLTFTNSTTNVAYSGQNSNMKVFYETTKPPIDLVTADINITSLEDMQNGVSKTAGSAKTVKLYKLLSDDSFEKNIDGTIAYRKNALGNYIDIDGNAISILELKDKGVPQGIIKQEGYTSINHTDGNRLFNISLRVSDDFKVSQVTKDIKNAIKDIKKSETVNIQFTGENPIITETFNNLALILILAVLLIYLVMVAQFQNLKSPFIIMFTIPLAFTGSILGLFISGMPLGIFAMVGLVLLVGVVVNNGIVFVDYVNKLMLAGMEKREALLTAGKDRIRPILMTALTTMIAMSMTLFDPRSGAQAMKPLAVTTIGGLFYSTLLTLFFIPMMYDLFNKKNRLKSITFSDDKEDDIEKEMLLNAQALMAEGTDIKNAILSESIVVEEINNNTVTNYQTENIINNQNNDLSDKQQE